ncbi:hypothetical protein EJB05_02835 [Eragrostis curvula]|uniref:xylose isomerase n=1 Tax=Eragrostis curvula TaxID=38414 RepID=A0A5J9WUA4_9POAL|nr:hypothetical protein EJB05_02835 [Eragrostis curvula]
MTTRAPLRSPRLGSAMCSASTAHLPFLSRRLPLCRGPHPIERPEVVEDLRLKQRGRSAVEYNYDTIYWSVRLLIVRSYLERWKWNTSVQLDPMLPFTFKTLDCIVLLCFAGDGLYISYCLYRGSGSALLLPLGIEDMFFTLAVGAYDSSSMLPRWTVPRVFASNAVCFGKFQPDIVIHPTRVALKLIFPNYLTLLFGHNCRVRAHFEFMQKLGVDWWCFHDRDIAPDGKTLKFRGIVYAYAATQVKKALEVGYLWTPIMGLLL